MQNNVAEDVIVKGCSHVTQLLFPKVCLFLPSLKTKIRKYHFLVMITTWNGALLTTTDIHFLSTQYTTKTLHYPLTKATGIASILLQWQMLWVPCHLIATQNMRLRCPRGTSWEKVPCHSLGKQNLSQVYMLQVKFVFRLNTFPAYFNLLQPDTYLSNIGLFVLT